MTQPFVHLRVHSEHSLVDSVVRVPALMDSVAAAGMPAVALTDQSNVFAAIRFYGAARKAGIKPLLGADLWYADKARDEDPSRLTLLCQDRQGYLNLSRLVTRSYLEGQHHGRAVIDRGWLDETCTGGLVALSCGREGHVGVAALAGRMDRAHEAVDDMRRLFGDRFCLEVQRTGRDGEEAWIEAAVTLSSEHGVPLVATNDVRFLSPDDFDAHEARVCINQGHTLDDPGRPRAYSREQYLRTPDEMAELFADLPEALANTVEVARRCTVELDLGESHLPDFPVPEGYDVDRFLRETAGRSLEERLAAGTGGDGDKAVYSERLKTELDVICGMGFAGYFLIVADFIRWAKNAKIPVGPGRGSGAGSLVAYVLGITDLDPIRYELLFERFLNPERVSMPDFDVDFCMEGRDRVIDYVAEQYGRDSVSQIITFGSMAAKAVVRDVGRVLGHAFGFVDRIAKLIPFEIGMTLDKALAEEAELKRLYDDEEEVRLLIDLARSLEGLARNPGKHAGGVVIAPTVLTDFTPLYCEEGGSNIVTQFDKDDVEAAGLVKFDFLGLRTLTIIDWALATVNALREEGGETALDIATIPLEDPATFDLLKRCDTTAVFQLESRGMKDLIKRLQPDHFDDIVALVALFRPGPLQSGMVDDYINRKHGRQDGPIDYFHPSLEDILKPTYGVILYQEQVMQIAQVLAGYSLGTADLLRRAMGKKKPEEMAKQRSIFMEGAVANGVAEGTATYIFDLMEKFAGYGFNKSHSAAYALLSYQTAWLKAHYPAAFMAAVLSADMDTTDKVVMLIDECHHIGLDVEPPDVNESVYRFSMSGDRQLRYGLGAIKGVGESAITAIIAEREANGPFRSLDDLCTRIDLQRVNRRVLEALIRAGALDGLGQGRATLMHALPKAIHRAEQAARADAAGQDDLFGLGPVGPVGDEASDVPLEVMPEWSDAERLAGEKDTLGLYLTGHPIEEFANDLPHIVSGRLGDLMGEKPESSGGGYGGPKRQVTVAGLVLDIRRRGNRVSLVLDDRSGRMEVTLFDEMFQQYRHLLVKDTVLVVEGALRWDDFTDGWRLNASGIRTIDEARAASARRLIIRWDPDEESSGFVHHLEATLKPWLGGECPVVVAYRGLSASARVSLGSAWSVKPTRELILQLSSVLGPENVRLGYPSRRLD